MKINRTMFLALSSALSAVACGPAVPSNAPPSSVDIDSGAPIAIAGDPRGAADAGSSTVADAASPVAAVDAAVAAPEKQDLKPDDPEMVTSKRLDPNKKGCHDSAGTVAANACRGLKAPFVEGDRSMSTDACVTWNRDLQPRIANLASQCLRRGNPATFKADAMWRCGYDALMDACPDPAAATACAAIADSCAKVDQNVCMGWLSGLKQEARAKMAACVESGCYLGFSYCFGMMRRM